jgi:hypothetical protein
MFRKVVRRFTLGALLVVSVAALTAATGGSAGLPPVPTTSYPSHDGATPAHACPGLGVNERHYCLVVTTYNSLDQNGGIEVDLTLENYDQSSLTNPTASLKWTDARAGLSFVPSAGPASCLSVTPSPGNVGQINCSFPNVPGVGSGADLSSRRPCGTPVSGPICSTAKLYFNAVSTVSSVDFNADADVKESNQQNGANLDHQSVDHALMTFDADTTDSFDATVALPNKHPLLRGSFGGHSASVTFPGGSSPFFAQFQEGQASACFPGVSCTLLQVTTDLSGAPSGTFSAGDPILWTAEVDSTNTNVLAVHYYDPVSIGVSSTPKTFTTAGTSFANCDGVTFVKTPPDNLLPGNIVENQDYFAINRATDGTNTTFQVATSATGKPITFTGSGPFTGSCIRIIGDQKAEKLTSCTAESAGPAPKVPPALCAAKLSNSRVEVYLWDSANGGIHY